MVRYLPAAALAFGLTASAAFSADPPPEEPAAQTLPAIGVVEVVTTVLRDRVIATGTIQPAETVIVQPQVEGQATEALFAEVGDAVASGEVLARLSDSALKLQRSQLIASLAAAEAGVAQARAQVAEAEASLSEAVRARDRARSLRDSGTVAQAALDDTESQATIAQARVNSANQSMASAEAQLGLIHAQIADVDLSISRTEIRAPVAGVVTERNARIGAIASAGGGAAMFTLIRDGALELHADVVDADLLRLAPGQPATIRIAGSNSPIPGTVRLVEPSVNAVTRLGRVRIALDNPAAVRDGMFGEAEIIVAEREAPAVPVTAVGSDGSVLRVDEGVVHRVAVTAGIRDGGLLEIREGLDAGEVLVARAGAFVREGDRINPVRTAE
ncbi:MAG: efflux RND transporter periplasmic adaptor subunit [Rhodobacteraceae bacterium]|jgi:HlyD family secretion protein|nr:efflux RND transporter periplasmic adaptor subunit [Paracoccaceae bacterium]